MFLLRQATHRLSVCRTGPHVRRVGVPLTEITKSTVNAARAIDEGLSQAARKFVVRWAGPRRWDHKRMRHPCTMSLMDSEQDPAGFAGMREVGRIKHHETRRLGEKYFSHRNSVPAFQKELVLQVGCTHRRLLGVSRTSRQARR
jgi:hypothetical protein